MIDDDAIPREHEKRHDPEIRIVPPDAPPRLYGDGGDDATMREQMLAAQAESRRS